MSKAMIIAFVDGEDQNNVIQDIFFDHQATGFLPSLAWVFVYHRPAANDPDREFLWNEPVAQFGIDTTPTVLVGNVQGSTDDQGIKVERFKEQERFEQFTSRSQLVNAVERVAKLDPDFGTSQGSDVVNLDGDSGNLLPGRPGGGTGVNPYGFLGGDFPIWLLLAGGIVLYKVFD